MNLIGGKKQLKNVIKKLLKDETKNITNQKENKRNRH